MPTRPDEIAISDPDPAWRAAFLEESAALAAVLGDIRDVQHIGSTAVPGLAAKPIVDIMVGLDEIVQSRREIVERVGSLGYVNVQHDEDAERLFFRKGSPRTHHLHVVRYRSWTYWKHLLFRDFLIDNTLSREEYECLKRVLAERHETEREAYVNAKSDFIEGVIKRAVQERVIVPR